MLDFVTRETGDETLRGSLGELPNEFGRISTQAALDLPSHLFSFKRMQSVFLKKYPDPK